MIHEFVYYLQDVTDSSEIQVNLEDAGLPEGVARDLADIKPFYEVTLVCEYDTEARKLTIKEAY